MSYPVTPTLSVAAVHVRLTDVEVLDEHARFVGDEGAVLSVVVEPENTEQIFEVALIPFKPFINVLPQEE